MKQHITIEQLEELDEKKICKLFDLIGLRTDVVLSERHINIGKMIEILDKDYSALHIRMYIFKNLLDEWELRIENYGATTIVSCKDELVDCLWEAVKEVL